MPRRPAARSGLTLVELVVVLLVLAALAGIAVTMLGDTGDEARSRATATTLDTVREAIVAGADGTGYRADTGRIPRTMKDLFVLPSDDPIYLPADLQTYEPATGRGWRGPYVRDAASDYVVDALNGFTVAYGANGDPTVLDGWSHPVVVQRPTTAADDEERDEYTRLVSAGPDGAIDTPANLLTPAELTAAVRDDDVVVFLLVADTP